MRQAIGSKMVADRLLDLGARRTTGPARRRPSRRCSAPRRRRAVACSRRPRRAAPPHSSLTSAKTETSRPTRRSSSRIRAPGRRPAEQVADGRLGRLVRVRDDDALAGRQPVGLDDRWPRRSAGRGPAPPPGRRRLRRLGGRDPGPAQLLLGEGLARLEPSGRAATARRPGPMPARRASATPAASGASGPDHDQVVSLAAPRAGRRRLDRGSAGRAPSRRPRRSRRCPARSSTRSTASSRARRQARACSRAPPPRTRTRISRPGDGRAVERRDGAPDQLAEALETRRPARRSGPGRCPGRSAAERGLGSVVEALRLGHQEATSDGQRPAASATVLGRRDARLAEQLARSPARRVSAKAIRVWLARITRLNSGIDDSVDCRKIGST